MIPLTPVLDHILSKRLSGQHQQQQQWQPISFKNNSKSKPTNTNKFTVLLDKHFESSPLSLLSNNPFFPLSSTMPSRRTKTIPTTPSTIPKSHVSLASNLKPYHKKQSSIKLFLDTKEGRSSSQRNRTQGRGNGRDGKKVLGRGGGGDSQQQSLYAKIISDFDKKTTTLNTKKQAPPFSLTSNTSDSNSSDMVTDSNLVNSKAYRIPENQDFDAVMDRGHENLSSSGSNGDSDGWDDGSDATLDWLKDDKVVDNWENKEWDDEDEANWNDTEWEKETYLDPLIEKIVDNAIADVYHKPPPPDDDSMSDQNWIDQEMRKIDSDGDAKDFVEDDSFDPVNTSPTVTPGNDLSCNAATSGINTLATTTFVENSCSDVPTDKKAKIFDQMDSTSTAAENHHDTQVLNIENQDTEMAKHEDDIDWEGPGLEKSPPLAQPGITATEASVNTSPDAHMTNVDDAPVFSETASISVQSSAPDPSILLATTILTTPAHTSISDTDTAQTTTGTNALQTGTVIISANTVTVSTTAGTNVTQDEESTVPTVVDTTVISTGDVPVPAATFADKYDSLWSFEYHPKSTVHKFEIDFILGCLITEVRKIDPTAYIGSWNNTNHTKLWSQDTFPKTDQEMASYIEDPHTTSGGKFGKLYGRIRLVANTTLEDIKKDPAFAQWIRAKGLFVEVSDIPSTRPTLVGFFTGKIPHATRIDIFKQYIQSIAPISRHFQIFSQTIYVGDGSDTKSFAYVLKADYKDAATIIQDLAPLTTTCTVKFHSWKDYRDHTDPSDKIKLIDAMNLYNNNHASLVFSGILENEYMRLKNNKRSKDSETPSSNLTQDQIDQETHKDLTYSHIRCLDFMQQHFVDTDNHQIFTRIDGPFHNKIEVTFVKSYFSQVQVIEQKYLHILALHMTPTSKAKCIFHHQHNTFDYATVWTPPRAIKQSSQHNPYVGRRSGNPIGYALTSCNSNDATRSYKDATILGRRQIDLPQTPSASTNQISVSTILTPALIANTDTTPATSVVSALTSELQEKQQQLQAEFDDKIAKYDERISRMDDALIKVVKESEANKLSLSQLTIEVQKKYTEINTTIISTQHESEKRITNRIERQSILQQEQNAYNNKLMAIMVIKLGGDPSLLCPPFDPPNDTDMHNNDTDTPKNDSTDTCPPDPSRTTNPMESNMTSHIQPISRNPCAVAGSVK